MKKYTLFRSLGSVDRDVKKHELIGVEYGEDIDDVTDRLIQIANDDILSLPQFKTGFSSYSYAPEDIGIFMRVKRYSYYMTVVAAAKQAEKGGSIEYGIKEEDAGD